MEKLSKSLVKIVFISLVILLIVAKNTIVFSETTTPVSDQYMELKLVSITDVDGKDKQVVMELWARNIGWRGMDVRFEYDKTKIKPSSFSSNDCVYDTSIFEIDSKFDGLIKKTIINDEEYPDAVRMVLSVIPGKTETQYYKKIVENGENKYYLDATTQDVLIGRMSFRLFNGNIDTTTFNLKTSSSSSPATGIKINYDGTNAYEDQSAFRFTVQSNDAFLSNLKYSLFDDLIAESPLTYTPMNGFAQTTYNYTINLNSTIGNKKNISLQVTQSDSNSTVVVKVPKRDSDGELVYNGANIDTENKSLDTNNIINVELNKLGEPDTVIEIEVTAEDGVGKKIYTVTIHKPYATIKGNVQLGYDLRDSMDATYGGSVYVEYIANITAFNSGEFDWDGIVPEITFLDDTDLLTKYGTAESDKDNGEFELYVFPGSYDILIERSGFLASVVKTITVVEGDEIDLGQKILVEGDVDRNGVISILDITTVLEMMDLMSTDAEYDPCYDFGQKGFISIMDLGSTISNLDSCIEIVNY